jgi:hypothetical protein
VNRYKFSRMVEFYRMLGFNLEFFYSKIEFFFFMLTFRLISSNHPPFYFDRHGDHRHSSLIAHKLLFFTAPVVIGNGPKTK